jgi:hypothetical protein
LRSHVPLPRPWIHTYDVVLTVKLIPLHRFSTEPLDTYMRYCVGICGLVRMSWSQKTQTAEHPPAKRVVRPPAKRVRMRMETRPTLPNPKWVERGWQGGVGRSGDGKPGCGGNVLGWAGGGWGDG